MAVRTTPKDFQNQRCILASVNTKIDLVNYLAFLAKMANNYYIVLTVFKK